MMEKEFKDKLVKSAEEFKKIFSEDEILALDEELISDKVKMFARTNILDVVTHINQLAELSASPVHIGMLGRYSHGKSALVNAIFDLSDDNRLPEGDGVVTSKVTNVHFGTDITETKAYQVTNDGERSEIEFTKLQNNVKSNVDTAGISYYEVDLPTRGKNFAENFAQKNINIIDLPGLGGPYFSDTNLTSRYIAGLDMVIVVIRIDQIEESSNSIRDYVESIKVPCITVLTYEDLISSSNLYAGLSYEEAKKKAVELIGKHLPSLQSYVKSNAICVSAPNGKGIQQLREIILNHVSKAVLAISKTTTEVSDVFRKKNSRINNGCDKLKVEVENALESFEKIYEDSLPEGSKKIDIKSVENKHAIKSAFRDLNKQNDSAWKDFRGEVIENIESLRMKKSISDIDKAAEKLNKIIEDPRNLKLELKRNFDDFKRVVRSEVINYVDSLAIYGTDLDQFKETVEEVLKDSELNLDELKLKTVNYKAQLGAFKTISGFKKVLSIFGFFKDTQRKEMDDLKADLANEFKSAVSLDEFKEQMKNMVNDAKDEIYSNITEEFGGAAKYNKTLSKLKSMKDALKEADKNLKRCLIDKP